MRTLKTKRVSDRTDSRFPYPTADEIAARAHELFLSDGRRLSRLPEYWRQAEAELLEQAARRWRSREIVREN